MHMKNNAKLYNFCFYRTPIFGCFGRISDCVDPEDQFKDLKTLKKDSLAKNYPRAGER